MSKLVYLVPDLTKCKIGEDYTKSVWYMILEENKKYISAIAKNSEVEFQSKEEGGKKVLTFIKSVGGESQPAKPAISKPTASVSKPVSSSTGPKCADCGLPLQDDKYETCYKCAMARKAKGESSPESSDKQRSIECQAMIKSASDVVGTAVAGQVNFADPAQAESLANFVALVATKLLVEFDAMKKR